MFLNPSHGAAGNLAESYRLANWIGVSNLKSLMFIIAFVISSIMGCGSGTDTEKTKDVSGDTGRSGELDYWSEGLTEIPGEVWTTDDLTHLNLRENELSKLPERIGELSDIKDLSLESNQIAVLPAEIGKLANLIHLDLSRNPLSSLPPEIARLTNLENLYLYETKITDADLEFLKSLKKLNEIDIQKTNVTMAGVEALKKALPNCYIADSFKR